jgi:nucleotide-binding universal stress UspA family protein
MTPTSPGTAATLQRERELAEAFLATAADGVRRTHPGLDVHTLVTTAESVPALLDLSLRSTLLVIGAHPGGLAAVVKGWGVDAAVAARTACPVVVVPRHHRARVRRGVLAGVDLGEHSGEVLDFAFQQASQRGLPLTVLACLRKGQDPDESRRRLAEVTAGYGERFPDVHVTCEVRRGRPAHELVLAAAAMNLLVVGRHQPTGVTHSPAGHVRSGVVDRSPCPVAVVPLTSTSASS